MPSTNPLVCIAVPLLNEVQYVRESLDSLLAQDYKPIQIVVCDGGSTDGTIEIVREYPVDLIVEHGLGQMAAINRVWKSTSAEFVTWWAGDDRYRPGAIRTLAQQLLAHPGAGFVYAWGDIIDEKGKFVTHVRPRQVELSDLMYGLPFLPQTTIIRRMALEQSGMMDEGRRLAADHDLFLRLLQYFPGCLVPFTAADRRIHADSEDSRNSAGIGQATAEILAKFFQRSDLTPLQSALRTDGMVASLLVPAWGHCINGERMKAFDLLTQAIRLSPAKVLRAPVGRRALARVLLPFNPGQNQLRSFKRLFRLAFPKF